MADINPTELRKVAEAATPGPWCAWNPSDGESHVTIAGKVAWRSLRSASDFADDETIPHWLDARHIVTFDPPTVLALLDRVADLEAELAEEERQHAKSLSIMEEALDQRDAARGQVARVEALAEAWIRRDSGQPEWCRRAGRKILDTIDGRDPIVILRERLAGVFDD